MWFAPRGGFFKVCELVMCYPCLLWLSRLLFFFKSFHLQWNIEIILNPLCKHSSLGIQLQQQSHVQPMSSTFISWWRNWSEKEENLIFTWFPGGSATFTAQPVSWRLLQTKMFILYGEDAQRENRKLYKGKDTHCRVTAIPWQNSPRGQAGVFAVWTFSIWFEELYRNPCHGSLPGGWNEKGWKQCLNPLGTRLGGICRNRLILPKHCTCHKTEKCISSGDGAWTAEANFRNFTFQSQKSVCCCRKWSNISPEKLTL